jgi:hypothetical protein
MAWHGNISMNYLIAVNIERVVTSMRGVNSRGPGNGFRRVGSKEIAGELNGVSSTMPD